MKTAKEKIVLTAAFLCALLTASTAWAKLTVTPLKAGPGEAIILETENKDLLDDSPSANRVTFGGGATASGIKNKDTQLVVIVPKGAKSGKIEVTGKGDAKEATETELTVEDADRKVWISTLNLGVQNLPDYDETGKSKGLTKTRPYGALNIDSRWTTADGLAVWNTGADLLMFGTPTTDAKAKNPDKFSDISDAVNASIYASWVPTAMRIDPGSEIGLVARLGTITMEEKGNDGSILNNYWGGGIRYVYVEGIKEGFVGTYQKPLSASIEITYIAFSQWERRKNENRVVIDAQYQLVRSIPWFIGLHMNTAGRGSDEFYITTSLRVPVEKLVGAFQ